MRVSVGDVELWVHERGSGRPLVALHGGPGLDGSVWFPGLDPLAGEGWRILAPDHRGNGRSDAGEPARWTVTQMADDVQALIEALELDRSVVMGWSFGSFVTQAHMVKQQIANSRLIKTAADKVIALDPKNDLAWHVLGRWYLALADVGIVALQLLLRL